LGGVGGPATPRRPAAAAAPDSAEATIARMVKAAEREGFEQHELARSMAIFSDNAVFVIGRREVADEHDVVLDRARMKAVRALRYRSPTSERDQMFFRDVKVSIAGDTATMDATVSRELFIGRDTHRHRYTLVRAGDGWKVERLRRWPLMRQYNGPPQIIDDDMWLSAEESAKRVMEEEGASLAARLTALTQAGYIAQAHAMAKAQTEAKPDDVAAWRGRAMLAFEMGLGDDATQAVRQALKLSTANSTSRSATKTLPNRSMEPLPPPGAGRGDEPTGLVFDC